MDAVMTYCEAFKDTDGKFYLKLVYEYDSLDGTHEVVFPKVSLPLYHYVMPIVNTTNENEGGNKYCINNKNEMELFQKHVIGVDGENGGWNKYYINCKNEMEFFQKHVIGVDGENYYVNRIVKPAVRKMTIDEIEKQLGYKIEIVSKNEVVKKKG